MRRYWITFSLGALLAIGCISYVIYLVSSWDFGADTTSQKFTHKAWVEKGADRMAMSDDLQIRYLRVGMARKQVIALLGRPDQHGHFGDTKDIDSYNLGYAFLDPCTLDLEFSKDEKLISFSVDCS